MKLHFLPSTLLLAALCAPASAQIVPVTVSAPINPVLGLSKSLPSPLSGPLAGVSISLPAPVATPAALLAAAPAAAPAARIAILPAPAVPVSRPVTLTSLPGVTIEARRENKDNPFRSLLPDSTIRFDDASGSKSDKDVEADRERLNQTFDGEGQPSSRPISMRRQHVKPSRRHTLPEADLEAELGL